jgi:hypothetical protein
MDGLTPEILEPDVEEDWSDESESELTELPEEELDELADPRSVAFILD